MRRSHVLAAPLALATAAATAPVAAQTAATPTPPAQFGILGGLNSATLSGAGFFNQGGSTVDRRIGFAGGIYLALPFGASGLAFRPEVLFAQKGARYGAGFTTFEGAFDLRADVNLSYVEVPLLLQLTVPVRGGVRPQLYAGPALALRTACRVEVRVASDGASQSTGVDCDDLGELLDEDTPAFRRVDVGGVVGGALAFDVAGRALTVGARYTHGFVRVADSDQAPKNRAVGVYGSVEFPLARRPR